MAKGETKKGAVKPEVKPLRKGIIDTTRIKTIKDVCLMFKLFNITMTEEHVMFAELEEKGFLTITDEVVDMKKNEG